MSRETFDDLFTITLGELYDTEAQLAVGLPVLHRAPITGDLEKLLQGMHQQTCSHMLRLEAAFEALGREAKGETCWSVAPLIVDAYDAMTSKEAFARHSGVGLALLSITHLQIIRYQSLIAWAMRCSMNEIVELLEEPLRAKLGHARQLSAHALAADQTDLFDAEPASTSLN